MKTLVTAADDIKYSVNTLHVSNIDSIILSAMHLLESSLEHNIKKFNETVIRSFCKENESGFTSFRIFNTFGRVDKFSIVSKLLNQARNNDAFTLNNNGLSQRNFINIVLCC